MLSFKDLFNVNINENLLRTQKLQYLKLFCHGDTLKIIKSIIKNLKYNVVWELLSEKFQIKEN